MVNDFIVTESSGERAVMAIAKRNKQTQIWKNERTHAGLMFY